MNLSALNGPEGWIELLKQVGFSDEELGRNDDRGRWLAECERTGAQLQDLSSDEIERLNELWPDFTTIEVLLNRQVQATLGADDFDDRLAALGARNRYRVRLTVDKAEALAALGASASNVRWYTTPQSRREALHKPAHGIETDWFGSAESAVVVVPDIDIKLSGPYLAIVGGRHLISVEVPSPSDEHRAAVGRWREWRKALVWEQPFSGIPPMQTAVEGHGWDHDIARAVARLSFRNLLLSTADRVRSDVPDPPTCEFYGPSGVVAIRPDSLEPSDVHPTAGHSQALIDWLFGSSSAPGSKSWVADRIDIFRALVFDSARPLSNALRGQQLIDGLDRLAADVQWHWRLFISGRIDQHIAAVDEYEEKVVQAVNSFAEETTKVTSSVVDAMKAAVATVIGSFIGAALATDFKETVFRVGMWVYAVYILAFPGVLGLGSSVHAFRTSKETFESAQERARHVLEAERVAEIEGSRVTKSTNAFWIAFGIAVVVFVCVAIAAYIAQIEVPKHIA